MAPDSRRSASAIPIRDDLHPQFLHVRQLRPLGRPPPVVTVAREDEPLPGDVLAQHERAEAGDLGQRRRRHPGLLNGGVAEGGLELVPRKDRQVVETRIPGANGTGR